MIAYIREAPVECKDIILHFKINDMVHNKRYGSMDPWIHGSAAGAAAGAAASAATVCTYHVDTCLLYTSPSPRDGLLSRMPSSA